MSAECEVIIPEGLHVETAADYAKPIPEPPALSWRDRIGSAAGRIALAKLTPRQHPDRCPICHAGDLDACAEPIREGRVTRQQRRANARESAKAPRTWTWLRCESCRATVRVLRRASA